LIIMVFENARCTCDSEPIHLDASSVTKKVDIRSEPASMITVEKKLSSQGFTYRDMPPDLTDPKGGWTLRDSHR
jgi:hypothetical protein